MPKLSPQKPREVIKKLKKLGFIGPFPGGKHVHMIHPETKKVIPVPVHGEKDVSVGLIRKIINEVGISRDEWIKL